MNKEKGTVRYSGYNPVTNENHYVVPSGFTDMPPIPFARLIAAAPDLLVALRMMCWGTAHHPACRSFKGPTCDCAHAEARNAIAKATESTN